MTPDVDDAQYARTVQRVIDDEIGRGEGANFVIRRDFHGRTEEHPARAVAGWMRRLLLTESNAYWTFALHTPGLCAVGATPGAACQPRRGGGHHEPDQWDSATRAARGRGRGG